MEEDSQFTTELMELPDLEQYKHNLGVLIKTNMESLTQDEIHELYCKYAVFSIGRPVQISKDEINKFKFFRVRGGVAVGEDIFNVGTFSYPKPQFCKENGRANLKNKPVFYCSFNPEAAINESKYRASQDYFMGIWGVSLDRPLSYLQIIPYSLSNNHPLETFIDKNDRVSIAFSRNNLPNGEHLEYLFDFISERYTEEPYPYCLTSYLSNQMLYENKGVDCITYPSAQCEKKLMNFAFHPAFVDGNLKLMDIYKYQVIINAEQKPTIFVSHRGEIQGEKIAWKVADENDVINLNQYFHQK